MNTQKLRSGICIASIASLLAMPLAAGAPTFPTGKYKAGEISLQFDGGGHFKVNTGDQAVVEGVYTASADQITLTDKSGAWACSSKGEETGTYGWKYAGGTLTLSKVEDHCEGRAGDLPQRGWQRQD